MNILQFHKLVSRATSASNVNHCLNQYLNKRGLKNFVVTLYFKNGTENNSVVAYDYCSESIRPWHQYYHSEHFDSSDVTSHQVKVDSMPVYWSCADGIKNATTKAEKTMHQEAISFGLRQGLNIPMYSSSGECAILMVALFHDEPVPDNWSLLEYDLLVVAHYYFYFLRKALLKESRSLSANYQLNARQLQCLQLTARKLSVPDIAKQLSLSERTVNYHLQKLNKQLGTKNKYLSVAKAKDQGLID